MKKIKRIKKIIYILKRLRTIDYKAMIRKINSIHKKTKMSKLKIFLDMKRCSYKYGAGYMDYDLFEMYNLTDEQRDTYLTRGRNNYFVTKYCDKNYLHYFVNKNEFNEKFKDYIKRDWINVNTSPKEKVIDFMQKHKVFMAKPNQGGCGKGIKKINIDDYDSIEGIYSKLISNSNDYELEEIIIQHPEVSKIHPYSINTIRVVTVVTTENGDSVLSIPKEERKNVKLVPHIIATYFRIGNGKFVDNFNNGVMTAPIDEKTGIVSQVAIDKNKNIYERHPLTNEPIKGFKFPNWNEVIEVCKKASLEVPEMGYSGWDVAITPDGPVFVEGNEFPGHDIYQLPAHTPNKIGMMPKFDFKNK